MSTYSRLEIESEYGDILVLKEDNTILKGHRFAADSGEGRGGAADTNVVIGKDRFYLTKA